MKRFVYLICLILLTAAATFAQEKQTKVLKYKAPEYPVAAFAVRAKGEVTVAVKIDKNGKVVSAKVENGHPLLREACENSAKRWIFSSQKNIEEREVKIIFNFLVGVNTEKRNYGKKSKFKSKFVKPYRIEIEGIDYY